MTALLAVEARRAWSRRIWKGLALFALGGIVLAGVLVFLNASPDSSRPDSTGFQARHLVYDGTEENGILTGTAIPFALLAFIVGASLIGAEWRAGTVGVVLAWEPRRSRVLLAKAAVAGAAGAAFALALQLVLLLALLPSASRATAGVDGEFWRQLVAVLVRSSLAAGLLALVGFGIASLGRNTSAAFGGILLYVVVVEVVLGGFFSGWDRWFLLPNLVVLIAGTADNAGYDHTGSAARSVAILLAYVAGLTAVATAWFRFRDVP